MKPTNHLRWIEKRFEADASGFGVRKPIPYTKPILQQFWKCEKPQDSINVAEIALCEADNFSAGEWRDIPTVKP